MKTVLLGVVCIAALAGVPAVQAQTVNLNSITTPIVPTAAIHGDRDFDGHGPVMVVGVELSIERNGRAIFAHVTFSAREQGGDGSATAIGPVNFEVWRWKPSDGANFVHAIRGTNQSIIRYVSGPGCTFGCGTIGAAEDGGLIVTVPNTGPGPVRNVTMLGDTSGGDISTDNNPHGDTSIRRITFNPLPVTFGPSLLGG